MALPHIYTKNVHMEFHRRSIFFDRRPGLRIVMQPSFALSVEGASPLSPHSPGIQNHSHSVLTGQRATLACGKGPSERTPGPQFFFLTAAGNERRTDVPQPRIEGRGSRSRRSVRPYLPTIVGAQLPCARIVFTGNKSGPAEVPRSAGGLTSAALPSPRNASLAMWLRLRQPEFPGARIIFPGAPSNADWADSRKESEIQGAREQVWNNA